LFGQDVGDAFKGSAAAFSAAVNPQLIPAHLISDAHDLWRQENGSGAAASRGCSFEDF